MVGAKEGWEAAIRTSSPKKSLRGQFHPVDDMKATQFFDQFPSSSRFPESSWRMRIKHDSTLSKFHHHGFLIDTARDLGRYSSRERLDAAKAPSGLFDPRSCSSMRCAMTSSVKPDPALTDTAEFIREERPESAFYEPEPRLKVQVEFAARSHPGNIRENNEDHYLATRRYRGREVLGTSLPVELLDTSEDYTYAFTVADGMGGRRFGEIASHLALQTGWELGAEEIKWAVKMNDREEDELRRKAEVFFSLIDAALRNEALANPRLRGMGTTLTICYSTGPELFVMHAGDSRAYLFRDGRLLRLTHDHTMGQILVDSGVAEPGSPAARKMSHVLTNCLGGPDQPVTVDVSRHRLQHGDTLLLCSDGLTDMLSDPEIADVLGRLLPCTETADALLNWSLERGGRDNVTVLLARYAFGA
jgi:protein phosphatase